MTGAWTTGPALTPLASSLQPLEEWFTAHVGRHRFLALLSPT